jgi:hypothetical protein
VGGEEVTGNAKNKGRSKFEKFVRNYGVDLLASQLGLQPSSIYHWLRGSTSPHPDNAIEIQRLARSRGIVLELEEIYGHVREVRSKRSAASQLKPQPARA